VLFYDVVLPVYFGLDFLVREEEGGALRGFRSEFVDEVGSSARFGCVSDV